MMRRTATVQANFDYASEADAMRKVMVSTRLSPLIAAMTANSPFRERQSGGMKSLRGDVWLHMDPARSGLIPSLWARERPTYRDYVEWALDAGMFLFKREGEVIDNSGQTFRSFLQDGYKGHRATPTDWKMHLNTLFPEVRLKNTIEVRGCDSLPMSLVCAVPALFTGLLYDEQALDDAESLSRRCSYDEVAGVRPALVRDGLAARVGSFSARDLALELLTVAASGLQRRGKGEERYLAPLRALTEHGRTPADELLRAASSDGVQRVVMDQTNLL
jgi:glutamate--cysteine ligase